MLRPTPTDSTRRSPAAACVGASNAESDRTPGSNCAPQRPISQCKQSMHQPIGFRVIEGTSCCNRSSLSFSPFDQPMARPGISTASTADMTYPKAAGFRLPKWQLDDGQQLSKPSQMISRGAASGQRISNSPPNVSAARTVAPIQLEALTENQGPNRNLFVG